MNAASCTQRMGEKGCGGHAGTRSMNQVHRTGSREAAGGKRTHSERCGGEKEVRGLDADAENPPVDAAGVRELNMIEFSILHEDSRLLLPSILHIISAGEAVSFSPNLNSIYSLPPLPRYSRSVPALSLLLPLW